MRRLDEWHKYVDIQVKRASTAKQGQSEQGPSHQPEIENKDSQAEQAGGQNPLLDGLCSGDIYADNSFLAEPASPSSNIVDDLLPEHFRPTPLPAMIEFAPSDLAVRSDPASEELLQAKSELSLSDTPYPSPPEPARDEIADEPVNDSPPVRNGRSTNGATRKETREELLARLLDPELTLEEAAQVLNVCPTTVRRYTNRGVLPHYRTIGNQRRFRLSQVLAFLETQESPSRSQILGSGQGNGAHAARRLEPAEEP